MNKSITLVFVFVFLTASSITIILPVKASPDSWIEKEPMNVARSNLGVAVVNGKIYAIGGGGENLKGIVGTNEEYDPATDTWTLKAPMPTPRALFAVAVYQNRIYCIGGLNKTAFSATQDALKVNEVYDPSTNTWETKEPVPMFTVNMGLGYWGPKANVVNGKIYLTDILINGTTINQVYDPEADSWSTITPIPPLPDHQVGFASVVLDNKIFVLAGFYDQPTDQYLSKMEIYDPAIDRWTLGGSSYLIHYVVEAGATTGAFALKRIYFFGQNETIRAQPKLANLMEIYVPNQGWTTDYSSPTNRLGFGVAVVNDTLYTIGGYFNTYPLGGDSLFTVTQTATNEKYTPAGYGTPDLTYQSPTPSPSSTSSPSPSPSSSGLPTPTLSPSPSPSPSVPEFPSWILLLVASIATIVVVVTVRIRKKNRSAGE